MKKYFTLLMALLALSACSLQTSPELIEDASEPTDETVSEPIVYKDLIQLESPLEGELIESSPLVVKGKARGHWFFEASFPVTLTNWDGLIIAESYATAEGEWMTEDYVPFTATLEFEMPDYGERGSLILQKANASGLPEHDDALEIVVGFPQP